MNHRGLALAWIGMLAFLLLIAIQPVGLTAQFTFAIIGVLFMCLVRVLRLGGIWIHMLLAVSAAIVFRYIYWRVTDTIPPISDPLNFVFGSLLLLAEIYSVGMLALSFFIVADPINRPHAAVQNRNGEAPTVDVFVPSYNEDLDIVGTTLAAAKNLDYPADKLNIYLLDDGGTDEKCNNSDPHLAAAAKARRKEMQAFCEELGVHYLTRSRNERAKAGNLNAGLERTNGDLVVVFDADHAPTTDFLQYTVGHFQKDPKLFLVQTPHFFLNPDPLERNLGTFDRMPSENEMFYSVIQKGLDKWNGTFFCGSAAVLSRAALETTAGFSGQSITEDCETALELHSRGWNSLYVDRAMIAGLQPETFSSFLGQRSRWCQGMLQILLQRKPAFRRGLSFSQRLAYTANPLFWLFPLSRLTFMIAPALFVFFDLQIYNASLQEFFAYTMFFLLSNVIVQNTIFGKVRWPWISELYEYVQSLYLVKSIASVFLNPSKPKFNVTAKGETLEHDRLSPMAMPYFLMFGFLAATTGWAFWRLFNEGFSNELLLIVSMWSVFNLIIGGISLGVVAEKRERRRHYRMSISHPAKLHLSGKQYPVQVDQCSIGGVRIRPLKGLIPFSSENCTSGQLALSNGLSDVPDYTLNVKLRSSFSDDHGAGYGLSLEAPRAMDRRAIAALLYRDNEVIEGLRKQRQKLRSVPLSTIEFCVWVVVHVARGFGYLIRDITSDRKAEAKGKKIPLTDVGTLQPSLRDLDDSSTEPNTPIVAATHPLTKLGQA